MIPIGIQQLMLGSKLTNEKNAIAILTKLKALGFSQIELNGFMIRKTPLIARVLTSLGGMPIKKSQSLDWSSILKHININTIAIHEDLAYTEEHFKQVVDLLKSYEAKYLVITGMYKFNYSSEESLGKLVVRLNRLGRELNNQQIGLLYHNHDAEYQHVDKKTLVMDYLLSGFNPKWVNFEFDSFWAIEAGADPLYWMNRIGERLKLIHLCDKGPMHCGKTLTPILNKVGEKEIGAGVANLSAIIKKAKELNVDAFILEQRKNYIKEDIAKSAQISIQAIKAVL